MAAFFGTDGILVEPSAGQTVADACEVFFMLDAPQRFMG
jgi:hypothetical protein